MTDHREPATTGRTEPAKARPILLELNAVRFGYQRQRPILDGLSLTVAAGEVVALVGRSGSGKSTVLKLAAGLIDPWQGTVTVAGQTLATQSESQRAQLRRTVLGFVFQHFELLPALKAVEQLELALALADKTATADLTGPALAAVGLASRRDAYPAALSGGEQQRVAVARALIHGPRLVLADEPTGNLDDEHAADVADLLIAQARTLSAAVLLVTHDRELADRADRVLHLRHGQLLS